MKRSAFPLVVALALMSALIATKSRAQDAEPAHFHHIHVNAVDPAASIAWYAKVFGATPVSFRGKRDALYTERSFFLFDKVAEPAPHEPLSTLWHIGWSGTDGPMLYNYWKEQGVEFPTPLTALGQNHYMYMSGPDKEFIEIYTGARNYRYEHVHLFCDDVGQTAKWFDDHLGLAPRRPWDSARTFDDEGKPRRMSNSARSDNVNFIMYEKPTTEDSKRWFPSGPLGELEPMRGRVIDHLGFAYRDIEPVYERMKAAGVKILEPIGFGEEFGMKSFLVEGPSKIAIEIVQERPLPEGLWD